MSPFSITPEKTPFQKHIEEEEAKKKLEQDVTERLYEEFLESFQGDGQKGSRYVPSFLPPPMAWREPERKEEEKPKRKVKHIDRYLEELKYEQEMRDKRDQEQAPEDNGPERDKWHGLTPLKTLSLTIICLLLWGFSSDIDCVI